MPTTVGDIMELYELERRELAKKDEQNFPYGKLDYVQVPGDPNLYCAEMPQPEPISLGKMLDWFIIDVHSLEHQHVNNPELGGKIILDYLVDGHVVVARREDGERPNKIAWQRWCRKKNSDGEFEFYTENSIANGPKMVQHYTTLLIDLDDFTIRSRPDFATYDNPAHLSSVAQSFVKALLSHHVKGDQIVQGLRSKLSDFDTNPIKDLKIYQEYLGGWNFRLNGNKVSAFTIINEIESIVSSPQ